MRIRKNMLLRLSLTITIIAVLTASCVPTYQLSYFNDMEELARPIVNPRTQKLIKPFDKLYVRVLSIDPQTNQIFNSTDEVRLGSYSNTAGLIGYLVDEDGNISFPFVGKINEVLNGLRRLFFVKLRLQQTFRSMYFSNFHRRQN